MTNWDKIKDSVHVLFPGVNQEWLSTMIWESMCSNDGICESCALLDKCNSEFFITNEWGDQIPNDNWCGCDKIILEFLNEEAKE